MATNATRIQKLRASYEKLKQKARKGRDAAKHKACEACRRECDKLDAERARKERELRNGTAPHASLDFATAEEMAVIRQAPHVKAKHLRDPKLARSLALYVRSSRDPGAEGLTSLRRMLQGWRP